MSTTAPGIVFVYPKLTTQPQSSSTASSTPAPSAPPAPTTGIATSTLTQGVITSNLNALVSQITGLVSKHTTPSPANILSYSVEAMQIIENVPQLTGAQKLQVLQAVINSVIQNSSLSAAEQSSLEALAGFVLPPFASIICQAAKGILNINKFLEEEGCSCFSK